MYANLLKCHDLVVPFNFKREPLYFEQHQFSLLTVYYVLVDVEALDSEIIKQNKAKLTLLLTPCCVLPKYDQTLNV